VETEPLSDQVLTQLEATLEHFNGNHADTILLLARFGAGRPEADDAEAVAVDSGGIDFAVRVRGEPTTARLEFPSAMSTYADLQDCFLAKVTEARATAGELMPITSLERELQNRGSLPTHIAEVVEVRGLTPNLVEIVLEGGFDEFNSEGGDQFLYTMVQRSADEPVPADHTMAAQMELDPGTGPIAAYYTARAFDAETGRLTLWAVLHGHDDGVGGWAARCKPGERVALWGPREGMGARHDARSHLFVADESGFAAVAALLDDLPPGAVGHAILETVDASHVVDIPDRSGVEVTWVFRSGEAPGVTNHLLEAVVDLDFDTSGLVAFGAAESRHVSAIRRYLRQELGMSAQCVYMTGYWRL
jgi:NADPH-dependent ferric siderophore reductase